MLLALSFAYVSCFKGSVAANNLNKRSRLVKIEARDSTSRTLFFSRDNPMSVRFKNRHSDLSRKSCFMYISKPDIDSTHKFSLDIRCLIYFEGNYVSIVWPDYPKGSVFKADDPNKKLITSIFNSTGDRISRGDTIVFRLKPMERNLDSCYVYMLAD
jgi:hypothetical protein